MSVLEPQDYFRLRLPSDPQISPDGRYIAYVRDRPDVIQDAWSSNVQIIERKSGKAEDLGDGFQPRWSPESGRLAFVNAGDDTNEIRLWSAATGEAVTIASLPSTPEGLAWSPDGRTIAFVMRAQLARPGQANNQPAPAWHALRTEHWARPGQYTEKLLRRIEGVDAELLPEGHHQIFLLDVATATIRQLTFDPFEHGGPLALITKLKLAGHISWSPDSRSLVMSMLRDPTPPGPVDPVHAVAADVYSFSIADGAVTRLTRFGGTIAHASVSPDGEWIAFVGSRGPQKSFRTNVVHVMSRSGDNLRALNHPDGLEVHQELLWLPDSSGLLALVPHEGTGSLQKIDLEGQWTVLSREVGGSAASGYVLWSKFVSVSHDGEIAILRGSSTRTDEVAILSPDGARCQEVTRESDWMSDITVAPIEPMWLATRQPMQAWLVRPADAPADKPLPMILWLHGGPYLSWGPHFAVIPQLWAARGYAVLMMNPRGSLGYGETFTDHLEHDFPGADDLMIADAVDLVVKRGGIDPERVYVAGESAGGVLTAWLIGHTHRFAAAAVVYGVVEWISQTLLQDRPDYFAYRWRSGPPWDAGKQEVYWRHSPLALVGNVRTPTIVLCGERDWRTPITQSEMYFTALKMCGVEAALVSYPDNNHGLERHPSQYLDFAERIGDWFERYAQVTLAKSA